MGKNIISSDEESSGPPQNPPPHPKWLRQDSLKRITYNKSVGMVNTWVRGGFSCVAEEHVSMFVVRNGLKNMIHQLLDIGEHMVGCRCLMNMDVMRSTITEYVC